VSAADSDRLRARLEQAIIKLEADTGRPLRVPPDAQSRLLAYLALIGQWNSIYSLTAIRDPAEMLVQHLIDSLAAVGPLQRHLDSRPADPSAGSIPARVLDVGSGAGLPGVVMAITCPALRVLCIDAVAKKTGFIRQAAAELGLRNLESRHGRVEQISERACFDVITSRAFASLADFTVLTRAALADGGVWMAMKGRRVLVEGPERAALPANVELFHVEQLAVPFVNGERCLVWMRPI
jgi:16S rRNA (guanine527-N7)-methyltransferase